MPTIEITSWGEFVGFTGWDAHARSELTKRLKRGVKGSPSKIKRLARQIHNRQLVSLHGVHKDAIFEITQMLETTGAVFEISLKDIKET